MDYLTYAQAAKDAGFTHIAPLDPASITLKEEVRQMCAACSRYSRCWSCPPACGTLEECGQRISRYRKGILVQTTGQLEDAFDGETMMETEALHKANFRAFVESLDPNQSFLPLSAGCCQLCKSCTCPDSPCHFPERMISSMEAYGMVVTEVCKANDLPYYYGENTITYTSCLLFDLI